MLQPNVIDVRTMDNFCLLVTYATGERRLFDVKPYLTGAWFGELKNPAVFSTVHPRGTTVEWEDGQDIAPHELYELSVPFEA